MIGLTIIIPSSGRESLQETVASAVTQMRPGDQLLVDVNKEGDYGNAARRRAMQAAYGDALLFMDDDDAYVEGALDVIRAYVELDPHRVHMFSMQYRENDFILFQDEEVRCGNVASQMVCVPNLPDRLGTWSDRYESDFDFISSTCEKLGDPVWHRDVIALIRHPLLEAV